MTQSGRLGSHRVQSRHCSCGMHLAGIACAGTRCLVPQNFHFTRCCFRRGTVVLESFRHSSKACVQTHRKSSSTPMVVASKVEMEITRTNFQQSLPVIKQALHDCQFFAFDCEMTGLEVLEAKQEYLDEVEDRYHLTASGGTQFALTQVGLSAFVWSETEHQYRPRTFNFYVFPKPVDGYDRRFLSQASSLEFLAGQGFDFNKWIYQGVPFMPDEWRKKQIATIDKTQDRREISLQRDDDKAFVQSLKEQVQAWGQTQDGTLLLDGVNSYRRAIQYQQLEKLQQSSNGAHGFYVQRVPGLQGAQLQLVRATPQEAQQYKEEERQARLQAIHDAAGFAVVFEMMRDSNKPAVGHNLSYDLTFCLASFAQALPPTWSAYKQLVQRWFPAGVWDTKHLARQLQGIFEGGTSLGDVYEGLANGGLHQAVAEFLADQTSDPSAWAFPAIQHAEGFEAYREPQAGSHAHEAGYDAYMTGAAFACLMRLYEAAASSPGQAVPSAQQQPSLDAVQHLLGRINVGRSDIPYAALWGADPSPDRSHVMVAAGLQPATRFKPFAEQLSKHLGVRVRVTPVWALITPQASVFLLELPPDALPDHANMEAALVAVRQPHAQLIPWAEYAAAKRAGTIVSLLESLQQSISINQAGKLKRPLEAVANSKVNDVSAQATAGKQRPAKKLKSMLPSCRMM
ncbi:hypothetical protein ABBQ32_007896 [Trebouxia sp. C0010 RCD-2024]